MDGFRNPKRRSRKPSGDGVSDAILDAGWQLNVEAQARAKAKGISPHDALVEIANELPEPSRTWALEILMASPEEAKKKAEASRQELRRLAGEA